MKTGLQQMGCHPAAFVEKLDKIVFMKIAPLIRELLLCIINSPFFVFIFSFAMHCDKLSSHCFRLNVMM